MFFFLQGTFLVTQRFASAYKEASLKKGSIVNLGSIAGKVGTESLSLYSASKAAIDTFSKSIAKELVRYVCIIIAFSLCKWVKDRLIIYIIDELFVVAKEISENDPILDPIGQHKRA